MSLFEDMFATPAQMHCVDPASLHPPHGFLHPSIRLPSSAPSSPLLSHHESTANGTRRHITLESLVPLDAPIQPRKYLTPSATSRRDVFQPMAHAPRSHAPQQYRSRVADEDEEDELVEEPLQSLASERQQQIEWKRRQNTLAARKSRQRKLLHQLELEEMVKKLSEEKETWKARAQTYEALLRSNGINVPELT